MTDYRLRGLTAMMLAAAVLSGTACHPPQPKSPAFPSAALDQAIGRAIGDPATCVLIADRATGKTVYRYGTQFNCTRGVPACDRPGDLSATQALAFATLPEGRQVSCPSAPDGSRMAGWAAGRVPSKTRTLIFSALMEGEKAMPGREIASRLVDAFQSAGL
jgi:hypothetical protein